MRVTKAIEATGFGLSGDIGGLPRTTYYTPDGQVIKATPRMVEYVKKRNGEVVEQGTRDTNLDTWSLSKPTKLLPHCPHCTRWHETKAKVIACGKSMNAFQTKAIGKARKEEPKDSSLEAKVEALTNLVEKLLKERN